jgi:hypothetical protein
MRPFLKNIWLAQFTSSAHSVRSSFLAGLLMLTKHKNRTAKNAAPRSLPTGDLSRAGFLRLAVSMGAAPLVGHKLAAAQTRDEGKAMQKRPIPLSGEALPVIGCGTYVGFDVGADPEKLKALADVVRTLRDAGGKVFDSSPMYGRAEAMIGDLLAGAPDPERILIATKVWARGRQAGITQMERSFALPCRFRYRCACSSLSHCRTVTSR